MSQIKKLLDNLKKEVYNSNLPPAPYIDNTKEASGETPALDPDKPVSSESPSGDSPEVPLKVQQKELLCEVLKREGPPSDEEIAKIHLVTDFSRYLKIPLKEALKVVTDLEEFYSDSDSF